MRPSSPLAALLTLYLSSVSAIQTIYLGTITTADSVAHSVAWFSDSDPCQEATIHDVGWNGPNGNFCAADWQILSHTGISFTGCGNPDNYPGTVLDGGAPALVCDDSDVVSTTCAAGSVNVGSVKSAVYCHGT